MIPGASPIIAGARYRAKAVKFDGSAAYLSKASALSGLADGNAGTVSVWYRPNGGAGVAREVLSLNGNTLSFFHDTANKLRLIGFSSGGTSRVQMTSTNTMSAGVSEPWHHVIASWRTDGTATGQMYIDDAVEVSGGSTGNGSIGYSGTPINVGRFSSGGSFLNGDIADLWFINSYTDLSVTANRRKFISPTGKPVSLGGDGSAPTGSQPVLYMTGPASSFNNLGTGGSFTVNGTLTDSTTSPSD